VLSAGVDTVWIPKFRQRCSADPDLLQVMFTSREIADCTARNGSLRFDSLAARFAAKEAVLKVLRIGFMRLDEADLSSIEIKCDADGAPTVSLSGAVESLARARAVHNWTVSLSHSHEYAIAYALGSA
jgi:holo-[acyl-carrier protein] synthase